MRRSAIWLCFGLFLGQLAVAADRPNVVLLLSDDQRWSDYSFLGNREITTPHIDRLAAESLVYTRGYVPTSLCRPSLASILTGRYPHENGITGNDPRENKRTNEGRQVLVERFMKNPRLPQTLREAGYTCFQAGKWWEGNYASGGFDQGMSHGDVTRGGRHGDEGLKIGREGLEPVYRFIKGAVEEGQPFFVWYAPMMPHRPHNPPEEYLKRFRKEGRPESVAKYYAMVSWWDQTCGDLLAYLDKAQLRENTIVLYLADNGWTQTGDKEINGAVGGPRGKRSVYDGGTRTPIMIRWPGRVEPRQDDRELASSIDLFPTVLAATGIARPAGLSGINLLDPEQVAARKCLFGEIYTHDVPNADQPAEGLLYRWVISEDWKLIVPTGADPGEYGPQEPALYRLSKDPEEMSNIAGMNPDKVTELNRLLDAWWSAK
ncbi:MAG: sulfatase [Planctomycetaceae bacterium]|nr:sulfatase [Planctomycetaceae bacterium]